MSTDHVVKIIYCSVVTGHYHVYQANPAIVFVAWLWQYSETKRKCARSFSSAIRLLEQYPQFTFVCSQVIAQFSVLHIQCFLE